MNKTPTIEATELVTEDEKKSAECERLRSEFALLAPFASGRIGTAKKSSSNKQPKSRSRKKPKKPVR